MSQDTTLHASAVAIRDRGLLIRGPSGAGKSSLALALIARGGALVADDRVRLARQGDAVILSAPAAIAGLIEARGIGLIRLAHRTARLVLACDLGAGDGPRLPRRRTLELLGVPVALIGCGLRPGLADALAVLLGGGDLVDPDAGAAGPG